MYAHDSWSGKSFSRNVKHANSVCKMVVVPNMSQSACHHIYACHDAWSAVCTLLGSTQILPPYLYIRHFSCLI